MTIYLTSLRRFLNFHPSLKIYYLGNKYTIQTYNVDHHVINMPLGIHVENNGLGADTFHRFSSLTNQFYILVVLDIELSVWCKYFLDNFSIWCIRTSLIINVFHFISHAFELFWFLVWRIRTSFLPIGRIRTSFLFLDST